MSSPTLSNSARRAKKTVPEDDVVDWAAMILPKVVTLAAERRQYTGWLKIKYPTGEYAISLQPMV